MFDVQETLFDLLDEAGGEPRPDSSFSTLERTGLSAGAWIDHAGRWLAGDVTLFDALARSVPWAQPEVAMYDRIVATPRLTSPVTLDTHPVIAVMSQLLSRRYDRALSHVTANWYRDGNDSVAWHGDRVARERKEAMVATVSLRGPRAFRYRPAEGGSSRLLMLGHGDLVVMGGSFQRTWRHAIPKTTTPAAPRMVLMFRHAYD